MCQKLRHPSQLCVYCLAPNVRLAELLIAHDEDVAALESSNQTFQVIRYTHPKFIGFAKFLHLMVVGLGFGNANEEVKEFKASQLLLRVGSVRALNFFFLSFLLADGAVSDN